MTIVVVTARPGRAHPGIDLVEEGTRGGSDIAALFKFGARAPVVLVDEPVRAAPLEKIGRPQRALSKSNQPIRRYREEALVIIK